MSDVIFYQTANGRSEVHEFIGKMNSRAANGDLEAQELVESIRYCLEMRRHGRPHASRLRQDIYELRPKSYRITYFHWRGAIVLLTFFKKQSKQTVDHEIERAVGRMKDWLQRHGK